MHIQKVAWLALGLMALGAASPHAAKPKLKQQKACLEIMAADREFSRMTGKEHLAGFMTFIDDSVGTLRPNTPVIRGREEMGKRWTRLLGNPKVTIEWAPIYAQASDDGTFGFSVGAAQFREQTEKGWEDAGTSKYITVWRRQANGTWKVLFDSGVQDAPPDTTKH